MARRAIGTKQRNRYNHPNIQKGWEDSSPRVGINKEYKPENERLLDEEYDRVLAVHDPLWRDIVLRYPKESESPLVVVGYNSIPIAIELSQWTYPVTFVTSEYKGVKRASEDGKIHAGTFQNIYYCDYLKTLPRGRVISFRNTLTHLPDTTLFEFLDMALRRSHEVVASEKNIKNWYALLKDRYDVNIKIYEEGAWCLLKIREKTD
ncbi:MAG: hypothetical protein IPM48_14985 [Saprospiraceae bacterium]|nr:hypothetical protein [Saprospiraceae bacterium]